MNQTLSSTAHVIHDLGLAAAFGGNLFGQLAFDPAARVVSDPKERGEIVTAAWSAYKVMNLMGMGASALTWFAGRKLLSGREAGRGARPLVLAKDVLVGTALVSGIASMITGAMLAKEAPAARVPMEDGLTPGAGMSEKAAKLQKAAVRFGVVQSIATAGIIGLTAVLDFQAGRSTRWSFVSRWLP